MVGQIAQNLFQPSAAMDQTNGAALDWYRNTFCTTEGHKHGFEGELDCMLTTLAELRKAGRGAPQPPRLGKSDTSGPTPLPDLGGQHQDKPAVTMVLSGPVVLDWGGGLRLQIGRGRTILDNGLAATTNTDLSFAPFGS